MTHTEFCYWLLGHVQSLGPEGYYNIDRDLVVRRLRGVLGEPDVVTLQQGESIPAGPPIRPEPTPPASIRHGPDLVATEGDSDAQDDMIGGPDF